MTQGRPTSADAAAEFRCDLCGSTEFVGRLLVPIMHLSPGDLASGTVFPYVRCAGCGLTSQHPRAPAAVILPEYEREDYHELQGSLGRLVDSLMPWYYAVARPLPTSEGGRLLDIGAGSGKFLRYARSRGWDVLGTEASAPARELARRRGVRVVPPDTRHLASKAFHLVTAFHVLEHVESPRHLLREIHRMLREEGRCLVQIPVLDSWDFRLWRERSVWFGAPQHLHMFTAETFCLLARDCGFDIERVANDWVSPHLHVWSPLYELDRRMGVFTSMEFKKLLAIGLTPLHVPWAALAAAFGASPFKTFELTPRAAPARGGDGGSGAGAAQPVL